MIRGFIPREQSMASYQRLGKEFWREQSRLCRESRLSQAEFCKRNNLAVQTFKRWHRVFAREAQIMAVPGAARSTSGFVPVILNPSLGPESPPVTPTGSISIRIDGCPWRVEVGPNFDATNLQRILAVLNGSRGC